MTRQPLQMLNPHEYEHKLDKKALNAVKRIPALKNIAKGEMREQERIQKVVNTGSSIKVTSEHFNDIYSILLEACANIHLNYIPDMYIGSSWMGGASGWEVNAATLGSDNPIILLSPGAVEYLTPDELLCVIGHEAGHIKSGHCLYHSMVATMSVWGSFITSISLGLGGILQDTINETLKKALNYWSRMSEFTADRAGLLACQDQKTAINVEMKLCGVPPKLYDQMDTREFIKQAKEFENYSDLNKYYKEIINLDHSHPWGVIRAYELLKWIKSGKYQHLLDTHVNASIEELEKKCIKCGNILTENEPFCGKCGSPKYSSKCPKCGTKIKGEEAFCGGCGKNLWTRN